MAYDDPRYRGESSFVEPEFRPVGARDRGRTPGFGAGRQVPAPTTPDPTPEAAAEYGPPYGYGDPTPGYQEPAAGYSESTPGYQEPAAGYGEPASGYGEPAAGYDDPAREGTRGAGRRRGSAAGHHQRGGSRLTDVFDDPADGEPGRDRMIVHLAWELVLLVGVLALGYLLRRAAPADLRGAGLKDVLLLASTIGLATIGMGLSLRAGAVNLAIGPVAYAADLYFVQHSDRGLTMIALTTVAMAVAIGLVLALVVVGLHVPSWAASLGLALAAIAWIQHRHGVVHLVTGAYRPQQHAYYWMAGVAALAVTGGLLGLVKSIRRGTGRFRSVGDPAHRRGVGVAAPAAAALVGSTALAAISGILIALSQGQADPAETGLSLTGLALGAALLGGTSAFGRRGGVFGSILAVLVVVLLLRYSAAQRWGLAEVGIAAAAIVAGLAVTRLVERFGRPPGLVEFEQPATAPAPDWVATATGPNLDSPADNDWSSRSGGWASPLSARTTDEGWGEAERWPGR